MLSNYYNNKDKHKMKRHYNDPGLQVGDKIRFVFQWEDEDGKIKTGDPSKVLTVIEVSIRSFVVEYVIEGTDKITTTFKWDAGTFPSSRPLEKLHDASTFWASLNLETGDKVD